jgi:MFS family permease
VALALTTATFKILQRSTDVSKGLKTKEKPAAVKSLQIRFLIVFWLLRCADWLQGPFFYEVYASKVFNGAQASIGLISKLFLTGFASTALFGPIVGRASDQYGRKKGTIAFTIIYALGAASTKSPVLSVLFLGRLLSGIGTSLLFSAPEAWLVGESQQGNDDPDGTYLGETFGMVRNRHEIMRAQVFLLWFTLISFLFDPPFIRHMQEIRWWQLQLASLREPQLLNVAPRGLSSYRLGFSPLVVS